MKMEPKQSRDFEFDDGKVIQINALDNGFFVVAPATI